MKHLRERRDGRHDDGHRDAQLRPVPCERECVVARAGRDNALLPLLLKNVSRIVAQDFPRSGSSVVAQASAGVHL